MLEYRRVGELMGAAAKGHLWLPVNRPLSYLRVKPFAPYGSAGLTRALLESRASEFRLRIPLVTEGAGRDTVLKALAHCEVSTVFPVLDGHRSGGGSEVDVYWLDWVQMRAVGRFIGMGFAIDREPVAVGGLELSPTFRSIAGGAEPGREWEYWNSDWEFATEPLDRAEWWRVRPNESRDRRRFRFLRGSRQGFGPQARGTFAACLHPTMREELGNPRYVVVEHPFREGWMPVRVLEDEFRGKEAAGEALWRDTIFLDRTARDALGIADGEFCRVHPWLHPRSTVWRRALRDSFVGSRTIAAHARPPARADLEKPICRLEPEALEAIGCGSGEFVVIERVAPPAGEKSSDCWRRIHMSQRVLPIDSSERVQRRLWEAPQLWDERSNPTADGAEAGPPRPAEAPELEGYVDCGERLGVHPPYPTIYLNYYTRRRGLQGAGLCQPVEVRVGVFGRLMTEASEFVWLAVIALLGAAIAFLHSTTLQIVAAVLLILATVTLLLFRAIRAIR